LHQQLSPFAERLGVSAKEKIDQQSNSGNEEQEQASRPKWIEVAGFTINRKYAGYQRIEETTASSRIVKTWLIGTA
jgi:hypothetical protein